jgi:predicted dehydrogenase
VGTGENEAIGVALVGYGYWGANLARNINAAHNLRLVGVVDASDAQRKAAVQAHPSAITWADLSAALDDPEVGGVVIAAPAALHADMAREVLGSGRHVMVEKPLAMTRSDAEEIVSLASTSDLIAMVGHTFLYSAAVERLKEYVGSGELGQLQYLYSQRLSLGRIRRDCNALWNFAPHDISILVHLLEERPVEVSATSLTMIGPEQADVFFAHLSFPSGIGAHLHVSWIDPRKQRLLTVVGDRKMAVYDDVSVDQKLTIVDAGVARQGDFGEYQSLGDFQWRTRAGDILVPRIEMAEPLKLEMEAFGAACASGAPPVTDARHGADVVTVLEAIDRSAAARGVPVEIEW